MDLATRRPAHYNEVGNQMEWIGDPIGRFIMAMLKKRWITHFIDLSLAVILLVI